MFISGGRAIRRRYCRCASSTVGVCVPGATCPPWRSTFPRQGQATWLKSGLAKAVWACYVAAMSTALEIEAAIKSLSSAERKKLVRDLPALLPELEGDEAWEQIIEDARPRPGLTKRFDEIEAEFTKRPESFAEICDADFDRKQ